MKIDYYKLLNVYFHLNIYFFFTPEGWVYLAECELIAPETFF